MTNESYVGWWFIASGPLLGLIFGFPDSWLVHVAILAWVLMIAIVGVHLWFEE